MQELLGNRPDGKAVSVPSGVDEALRLAGSGLPIFPLRPSEQTYSNPDLAAALGVPEPPQGAGGFNFATTDPDSIRAMWRDRPSAEIGIRTGAASGFYVLDIDKKKGKDGFAALQAKGLEPPSTYWSNTRNGGRHYYYKIPREGSHRFPSDSSIGPGIDRKGDGGYVRWYGEAFGGESLPIAEPPAWMLASAGQKADRQPLGTMQTVPAHIVEAALDEIHPNDCDYDDWRNITAAYRGAGGKREKWDQWCTGYDTADEDGKPRRNDLAANNTLWRSLERGTELGWPYLARHAPLAQAWAAFGQPLPAPPANVPPMPANDTKRRSVDAGGFFIRVADMVPRPPVFLIDRLLEQDALASLFGDPASGKSLVAIEMAGCVSKGEPFHGHAVRAGAVFYVAGEGKNGLRRRFAAWEELRGVSIADAPLFASTAAVQLLDAESAAIVTAAIDGLAGQHGTPRLIVIDTLARNFGPGDENSTADMNTFVAALDRLRERYPGATVLLVHHSGHGEKSRGRGSSVLRGAVDKEYRVEKKGETVMLSNSKMKDAPPPPAMQFELVEAAGSVALEYSGEPGASSGGLSPNDRTGLEAFQAVAIDGAASDDDWRAEFYDRLGSEMKNDSKKRAYHRSRTRLVNGKYLQSADDGQNYKLAPMPGQMPDR